jgi:PBP1b-binding outer membrane lipoprotein LpoB
MVMKINKKVITLITLLILLAGCADKHQEYFNKIKKRENLSYLFTDKTIRGLADICAEDEEGGNTLSAYQQSVLKYQKLEQDMIQSMVMAKPSTTIGDVVNKKMLLKRTYSTCKL